LTGDGLDLVDPPLDALADDLRERLQLTQAQRVAIRKAVADKPVTVDEATVYSWESQAKQYPEVGPPGTSTFQVPLTEGRHVNCVLHRDTDGALLGILNHYPVDIPPWERKYTLNVWVHPDRRGEGIGTRLVMAAMEQGWPISVEDIKVTGPGGALTRSVARRLRKDVATAPLVRVAPGEGEGERAGEGEATVAGAGGDGGGGGGVRDSLAVAVRARLQMSDEEVDAARREREARSVAVPDDRMLTWESQARQYPESGAPGISTHTAELPDGARVNCLLMRDPDGRLVGILNHYPEAISPIQKVNTMNVWVHPERRRQGIGSKLVLAALQQGWPVDLGHVAFTSAGDAMAKSLSRRMNPPS
jgi:GNAT superfamily N-acetyltransferase